MCNGGGTVQQGMHCAQTSCHAVREACKSFAMLQEVRQAARMRLRAGRDFPQRTVLSSSVLGPLPRAGCRLAAAAAGLSAEYPVGQAHGCASLPGTASGGQWHIAAWATGGTPAARALAGLVSSHCLSSSFSKAASREES